MQSLLIVLSCLLLAGLFFSIRAIVLRRHVGCGIAGVVGILAIISLPFLLLYLILSPPMNFHKDLYRSVTGLEYPSSAKVVKKGGSSGWTDYAEVAIIRVDTSDYNQALQAVQAGSFRYVADRDSWIPGGMGQSLVKEAGIEMNQVEHLYEKGGTHRQIVGFHRNKQVIIVEKFRN